MVLPAFTACRHFEHIFTSIGHTFVYYLHLHRGHGISSSRKNVNRYQISGIITQTNSNQFLIVYSFVIILICVCNIIDSQSFISICNSSIDFIYFCVYIFFMFNSSGCWFELFWFCSWVLCSMYVSKCGAVVVMWKCCWRFAINGDGTNFWFSQTEADRWAIELVSFEQVWSASTIIKKKGFVYCRELKMSQYTGRSDLANLINFQMRNHRHRTCIFIHS